MQVLKYFLIFLTGISMLFQTSILGQSTQYGQLKGSITDAKNNEPLPGVNLIVVGTVLGTSTNLEGIFSLIKIPVGSYQLKATMMGYEAQTKSVTIRSNQITELDFKLTETVIETPALVVTASKRRQSIQDSPTSLSVITSNDIERVNEAYLDQALKNAPGVHFTVNNINVRGSSGFSRGAGSRVLLLVDGIPMMPGDSGDIKWDVIPITQVKQVEIVKGAGSALYGSQALGGIVNVITKEPSEEPKTNIRFAAGMHDKPYWPEWEWTDRTLHFTQVDVSHSHSFGKLNLVLSGNKRQDTGFSQNSHYQTWSTLGKLRYSFSPQTYLIFNTRWNYRKAGELILWKNQHDALRVPDESIGQETNSSKLNLSSIFRKVVNRNFAYKVQAAYLRNWWKTQFPDHIDESTGDNIRAEAQFDLEPCKNHSITTGSEIILDYVTSNIFGNHDGQGWAGYLQHQYKPWQPLAVTAGLRFDFHQVDEMDAEMEWSPKVGLVYRPTQTTSIRTSAGKGFRTPTMAEMFTSTVVSGFRVTPNENLTAERSWSYELGLNQYLSKNIYLDLALFSTDYWDLIEGQPDEAYNIQFKNLTRARISGAEINLKTMWFHKHFGVNLNYTFMDPKDITLDKSLAYRPRHLASVAFDFNYGILGINLDYRYNSRIEEVLLYPEDDRVENKVMDAKVSLNWQNYQLAFDADNIFQYHYVPVERNIAPIRRYMITLSAVF